jgi:hypothetical protein
MVKNGKAKQLIAVTTLQNKHAALSWSFTFLSPCILGLRPEYSPLIGGTK